MLRGTEFNVMRYKGVSIDRVYPSGYYTAYVGTQLVADTISGIKNLIRERL